MIINARARYKNVDLNFVLSLKRCSLTAERLTLKILLSESC